MKLIHYALLAAMAMPASADSIVLPGADYSDLIGVTVVGGAQGPSQESQSQAPGNYSVAASPSNNGGAAAGFVAQPFPALSLTEAVTQPMPQQLGYYAEGAVSNGSMRYYIEFTGPTATVPVLVNAFLSTSIVGAIPASSVDAQFRIADLSSQGAYVLDDELQVGQTEYSEFRGVTSPVLPPVNSLSLNDSGIWIANTNTLYAVLLTGNAQTYTGNDPSMLYGGNGSAFVDPTFQIASTVADPQDYSIALSPGIGNTPAAVMAPEPASSALALTGAGAICWMLHRRRKMMSGPGQSC